MTRALMLVYAVMSVCKSSVFGGGLEMQQIKYTSSHCYEMEVSCVT